MNKKQYLRLVDIRLQQAQDFAFKASLDAPIIREKIEQAREAVASALDPLLIKCGTWEPLNENEEVVYDKLQFVLRFDDDLWANVTPEQRFSAARVIMRQGGPTVIRHPVSGGAGRDMIGISFGHIFIGIEPDGYAHS
jgi:hypothetical protein